MQNNDITTLDWNSKGSKLATGCYDGLGRVWSNDGKFLTSLKKHEGKRLLDTLQLRSSSVPTPTLRVITAQCARIVTSFRCAYLRTVCVLTMKCWHDTLRFLRDDNYCDRWQDLFFPSNGTSVGTCCSVGVWTRRSALHS